MNWVCFVVQSRLPYLKIDRDLVLSKDHGEEPQSLNIQNFGILVLQLLALLMDHVWH